MTIARLRELLADPYSATAEEIRWLVRNMGDPELPREYRQRKPREKASA